MNQTYGSQPSFAARAKEFYAKYRLYVLILIGVLVGGVIAAFLLSGNKSGTDPSNQSEPTSGQPNNSEISDLSQQSGKSSGNANKSGISGGNANKSGISGGNANKSLSQQSRNNPFGSTGGLFTEKESELDTSNSSTEESKNEPPKYYSSYDKNPILDQIASGNTAEFQAAIQSNPNWIIHALYLAMENSTHYPNISTDYFLQLLENYKSGEQSNFCISVKFELFPYFPSSRPEIAKIWGASPHNVSKIIDNLRTIQNVCNASSRKNELVTDFVENVRGYSGPKLTSIDFKSIWFNYVIPTEKDKDEDFKVLKKLYDNVDTSLLKSFDKFYLKFSGDFFFDNCSNSGGDSELIKVYFECRPEEIKKLKKVDYSSLKSFISDDKIDIEIRKNFIKALSGKDLSPLLYTVRNSTELFTLVDSVSVYPAQLPIDFNFPSIIYVAISKDMNNLKGILTDSIVKNASSIPDDLKEYIIRGYVNAWRNKSSDSDLKASLELLYNKGILTLANFSSSVSLEGMPNSRKFIVDKLVTDSSTAYELLNKYSKDNESEEENYEELLVDILPKDVLDDYSSVLLRFTTTKLNLSLRALIDLKNKYDGLKALSYDHDVWNQYKPFDQMPNLKKIYDDKLAAARKHP